jgi:hypothetical protein
VWYDKMAEFLEENGEDYFANEIYQDTQVLIGTRRISEFNKIVETHNPYVIYLNADERLGVSSSEFEISYEYACNLSDNCFKIYNSGVDYHHYLEDDVVSILTEINK